MPIFGQVVVGPPGSGKTTYCRGMKRLLEAMGRRPIIINLDPANINSISSSSSSSSSSKTVELTTPSSSSTTNTTTMPLNSAGVGAGSARADTGAVEERPDVCISELITTKTFENSLGPNGALMACAETLEKNVQWLDSVIKSFNNNNCYFLFDLPGQAELVTHHQSFSHVFEHICKVHDLRLCVVNLVDSICCVELPTYVSALVISLMSMLQLALPHINVLSKIDLIGQYGPLPMPLEFFTDSQGLHQIVESMSSSSAAMSSTSTCGHENGNGKGSGEKSKFCEKYISLTESLCEVVEDFGLVSFTTLSVTDSESMIELLHAIDKANGFAFSPHNQHQHGHGENEEQEQEEELATAEMLFGLAAGPLQSELDSVALVRERYHLDDVVDDGDEKEERTVESGDVEMSSSGTI